MYSIEVKIPKELRQHQETIFFGLSARQFICALLAVGIAVACYLGLGDIIGKETASWLCMILAAPVAVAGFFHYNGMNFEQFARAYIRSQFLCAGERKFVSQNIYYNLYTGEEDWADE